MALLLTLTSVVSHAVRTRTSMQTSSFVRGGVGASASAFSRTGGPIRMMALKAGIVGLPNVGKSTLFNALMGGPQAQAANFPFCTIEPNTGVIAVPDKRLDKLAEINKSVKKVPTSLSFVDIAGLVKGRIMSPTAFQWQSQLKQRLQVCVRLLGAQRLFVGTRRRPMHLGMVSIPTAWRTSN